MTTTKPHALVALPFQGFYCSLWSDALDSEETQWVENQIDNLRHGEESDLEPLRDLDEDSIAHAAYSALFEASDYGAMQQSLARAYVEAFDSWLQSELPVIYKGRVTFESLDSPQFYNFSTDRIFAYVPLAALRQMRRILMRDYPGKLEATFAEALEPRSGFIPFYDAEPPSKPLSEWDHNELGLLVEAFVSAVSDEDLDWTLHDWGNMHESVNRAWESGIDWQQLPQALADARRKVEEKA